ncbi:MAG TPA: hypothetical protein VFL29_13295 [Candidatus Dormibacteraeota bacterium]|nr:hypothetical protein [Candidatus Dormibacteraeota bacterium]
MRAHRYWLWVPLLALTATMVAGTPAAAASGGGCQLQGTANFAPPLSNNAGNFQYNFGGALSACQSTDSTAPATGSVEAGKTMAVNYAWSYVDPTTGQTVSGNAIATYQEPIPTGSGSCGSSTTSGTAIVTWADGTRTVESYSTTGAAAAVSLTGSVANSVTLTLVSYTGPAQAPPAATYLVSTNRFRGDSAQGTLIFQPPDPTLCATTGVTSAGISGEVTLDSAP